MIRSTSCRARSCMRRHGCKDCLSCVHCKPNAHHREPALVPSHGRQAAIFLPLCCKHGQLLENEKSLNLHVSEAPRLERARNDSLAADSGIPALLALSALSCCHPTRLYSLTTCQRTCADTRRSCKIVARLHKRTEPELSPAARQRGLSDWSGKTAEGHLNEAALLRGLPTRK